MLLLYIHFRSVVFWGLPVDGTSPQISRSCYTRWAKGVVGVLLKSLKPNFELEKSSKVRVFLRCVFCAPCVVIQWCPRQCGTGPSFWMGNTKESSVHISWHDAFLLPTFFYHYSNCCIIIVGSWKKGVLYTFFNVFFRDPAWELPPVCLSWRATECYNGMPRDFPWYICRGSSVGESPRVAMSITECIDMIHLHSKYLSVQEEKNLQPWVRQFDILIPGITIDSQLY